MKSSENRITSAWGTRARASRARARLPAMSPITGLSCAKAMRKGPVMPGLEHFYGEKKKPGWLCHRRVAHEGGAGVGGHRRSGLFLDQKRGFERLGGLFRLDQRLGAALDGGHERGHRFAQR